MYYLRVFKGLNRAGVRCPVAGGVALNLHGVPRMTADLDLLPDLGRRNLESLLGVLETSDFVPVIPVASSDLLDPEIRAAWARKEHLVAFPFHNPRRPFEAVDLLVNAPVVFDEVWGRRTVLPVDGTDVPVLSTADLSAMKRRSGRPQNLADAEALDRLARLQGSPVQ